MAAQEAKQRTWLLAYQLSISYGSSRTCRSTVSALANLFPGLRHFSLAVVGSDGCMVTSTSKAQAGPRTVALHLEGTSCVGMVATKGSALQASLEGPGGALLSKLSDIQHMIKETEASSPILHIVCIPIQPSPGRSGVKGALLLGFSSTPNLSSRRTAGVAALCSMLSETLAQSSTAVICNVETMIGRHQGCACCFPDSDDELNLEDDEEVDDEPCNDKSSGRKDRGRPPRQSMLIPIQEDEEDEETASGRRNGKANSPRGGNYGKENRPTIGMLPPAAAVTSTSAPNSSTTYSAIDRRGYRFSKPVTASVTLESLQARNALTLSYTDPALENEFSNWFQDRLKPVDFLFSMLVVASVILLAYCQPGDGTTSSSTSKSGPSMWSNFVALPLLFPVILAACCSFHCHQKLRELLVASVRMYLVVAASRSAVSQMQAAEQQHIGSNDDGLTSPTQNVVSFLACWIAAGGETLFTPAFGLQMRMKWHLPLQTAAVAVMCYNVQSICGSSFYQTAVGYGQLAGAVNNVGTVAAAVLLGLVLPTAMLRVSELKSRQQFEAQIRVAAGISVEV